MVNIDSKIINMLDENEFYLFAILLNYGKKSCPKNEALKTRTGWAMNKLQATKKSLIDKGLLKVMPRTIGKDGKRVNSNEYVLTTNLASKYNGKKEQKNDSINELSMIQIEVLENRVLEIEVPEIEVSQIKVLDFEGDYKVLKLSIIENIKELLKGEKEKATTPRIIELENQIDQLNAKIQFLEKPRHTKDSPLWVSEIQKTDSYKKLSEQLQNELIRFCMYRHNKADKGIVFETAEQILKKVLLFLDKYQENQIIESFELCIENNNVTFDPAFVENRNKEQSQKAETGEQPPEQLEGYLLKHYQQKEVEYFKKEGKFEKWQKELEENRFRLTNMAKGYKNENITPLLLFEMFYLPLSYALNGSSPTRKQEAFERLFDRQSQYNQDKGDFRQIIKQEYEKQKA